MKKAILLVGVGVCLMACGCEPPPDGGRVLVVGDIRGGRSARQEDEELLAKWRCTARHFRIPESADLNNIEHIKLAIRANPERFEPQLWLAGYYARHRRFEKALVAFEKTEQLMEKAPADVRAKYKYRDMYAGCLATVGMSRYRARSKDRAAMLRMLEKSLEIGRDAVEDLGVLPDVYMTMAAVHLDSSDFDRAEQCAREGIRSCGTSPRSARLMNNLTRLVQVAQEGRAKAHAKAAGRPPSDERIQELIGQLVDKDSSVRRAAATELGLTGLPAVPALIRALRDETFPARAMAAMALGDIGPPAKAALPDLTRALKAQDTGLRCAAALSLGKIRPEAKSALLGLVRAAGDKAASVRAAATWAIGEVGPDPRLTFSALAEALKDPDFHVRYAACGAFARMGPPARAVLPELAALLKDADARMRNAAAVALGQIGPDARSAVPALIRLLEDTDRDVRLSAIAALGGIGPDARPAVPHLTRMLEDKNARIRNAAEASLKLVQRGPPPEDRE